MRGSALPQSPDVLKTKHNFSVRNTGFFSGEFPLCLLFFPYPSNLDERSQTEKNSILRAVGNLHFVLRQICSAKFHFALPAPVIHARISSPICCWTPGQTWVPFAVTEHLRLFQHIFGCLNCLFYSLYLRFNGNTQCNKNLICS